MNEKRIRLEKEIRRYKLAQLEAVFSAIMEDKLENYVIAPNLEIVVFQLLEKLEMDQQKLIKFLLNLRVQTSWPSLRSAIDDYFGLSTPAPYTTLVAYGEPIVDRKEIRDNLEQLFQQQPNGSYFHQALVASGPRYSGRSHVRWLIQHITKNEDLETVLIDLADSNLEDIILYLKNNMSLPSERFPDANAQLSRQAKAFPSALGGHLREQARQTPGNSTRWCLVFDHYDLLEVADEARSFVDKLVEYATENRSLNLWIIVLGHNNSRIWQNVPGVLTVDMVPLNQIDVRSFLAQITQERAMAHTSEDLDTICTEIFDQLQAPPLDLDGMKTMRSRLGKYIN